MRKLIVASLLFCTFSALYAQPQLSIQQFATGLVTPVGMAHAGDDRLFVLEIRGRIKIVSPQGVVTGTPFLDITDRVNTDPQDHGLIGLAFHPDYAINGYFFVHYIDTARRSNISRFKVSANPNVAIAASEDKLVVVAHPFPDHYGGDMAFGPDGYLYFTIGDGHTNSDPGLYAQDLTTLLGKMSRIDVDTASGYRIPPTNPYVNDTAARPEIWSSGFRNPWRFSFDRHTNDLWISDVGQSAWEEISMEPAGSPGGLDYGWPCYEGSHAFDTAGCNGLYVPPVHDYPNAASSGCSVIGGYVYRGCKSREFYGHYVFTDYCSSKLWTLYSTDGNRTWTTIEHGQYSSNTFSTFGEDAAGELYLAELFDGKLYKIVAADSIIDFLINVPDSQTICPGDSLTLSIASAFGTYAWMRDGVLQDTTATFNATLAGTYHAELTWNGGCPATSDTFTLFTHPQPPAIAVSVSDSVFCPGDSVQLSASTSGTFAYAWSTGEVTPSVIVGEAGSYFIEGTDTNGCKSLSPSVQITQHPLPVPAISGDTSFCSGSSLTLSTGSYVHYNWSTGDTTATTQVEQPGNYSVEVVDTNGCVGQDSLAIIERSLPVPVINASRDTFCAGDAVVLSTGNYIGYFWTGGSTSATLIVTDAGAYTVDVLDSNGCSGQSLPITITMLPVPAVALIPAHDTAICSDETLTISVDGAFTTYTWSNGETGAQIEVTATDLYSVTVEATNGCPATAEGISVTVFAVPEPSVEMIDDSIFSTVSGATYEWYFNGSFIPFQSQQWLNDASNYGTGNYSVLVTDSNGCSALSEERLIVWEGIAQTELDGITIYPNPFENEMLISGLKNTYDVQITLLDVTGNKLYTRQLNGAAPQVKLDLEKVNISPGFYFVKLDVKSASKTFRLIRL